MDTQITVRDVISLWPSRAVLADDIHSPDDPVTLSTVHKWAQRNSIPPRYHALILRAAAQRLIALSADELVAAHERLKKDLPQPPIDFPAPSQDAA